jgi:hypothetical protein
MNFILNAVEWLDGRFFRRPIEPDMALARAQLVSEMDERIQRWKIEQRRAARKAKKAARQAAQAGETG